MEQMYTYLYDILETFELFASYMKFLDHSLLHNNATIIDSAKTLPSKLINHY
jgi:uncharacterized protein with HEPN domain